MNDNSRYNVPSIRIIAVMRATKTPVRLAFAQVLLVGLDIAQGPRSLFVKPLLCRQHPRLLLIALSKRESLPANRFCRMIARRWNGREEAIGSTLETTYVCMHVCIWKDINDAWRLREG